MAEEYLTRAVVFSLDPSRPQERLAYSYAGSRRFAYNWVIGQVIDNLRTRDAERKAGVAETALTPSLSWSARSLSKAFNAAKEEVAPWWREVSMHAFRSGIADAAQALANFSASKKGVRRGRPVGFPRFKARNHSTPSVSFVEINHQLSWFHPDRHHIRLMLPQASPDPDIRRRRGNLAWIHTVESTRRLYKLVETGRARIQKVTFSFRGGRWQVSFSVRYLTRVPADRQPVRRPVARHKHPGGLVGVDVGISHLATLSRPVPGLTDAEGHIANPRVLEHQLAKLAKLDQAIARTKKPSRYRPASKNRMKLLARRARLHGTVAKTRALHLHRLTNALLDRFDAVAIEDLDVLGMMRAKNPATGMKLGRSLADVSFGEFRRQLSYKCTERGTSLVTIDRFYPSSKTCSTCAEAAGAEAGVEASKAKMPLDERVFKCNTCGVSLDRDVNAARNIAREGARLLSERRQYEVEQQEQSVAGLRPETQNADQRRCQVREVHASRVPLAHGQNQAAPPPLREAGEASASLTPPGGCGGVWDLDGVLGAGEPMLVGSHTARTAPGRQMVDR